MLVYIKPCTNAPDFSIITGDPTTSTGERAIRLAAWGFASCTPWSSVSRYPNRYH